MKVIKKMKFQEICYGFGNNKFDAKPTLCTSCFHSFEVRYIKD